MSNYVTFFLFILIGMTVEVNGRYSASLPAAGCPSNYLRINNACYQLVFTIFNWTDANASCYTTYAISQNDSLNGFTGTVTHLAAFESLAEIMTAYIWLQGAQNYTRNYTLACI